MADVFISYSRKDKDFVKELHTALAKCDRDVWVDWQDIPLTADWWQEIERGVEAADTFVFVVSSDSVASKVCNQEIGHAVKHHKRLVPVVRRDDFDRQQAHEALRRHNWLFFREEDDFEQSFQSLLDAIDMDLEHVHDHTRLLVRAIEWDEKKQDDSFLLRGNDLKSASRWLSLGTDKDPKPTALQTQYILASGKAEIQRQRRTSLISMVGFVGAIGLALLAFTQYQQAKQRQLEAEKGQILALSASASANLASNKDIEALIDSVKVGQQLQHHPKLDVETQNQAMTALQQVVYGVKERVRLEGHSDYVRKISFSPNGQTIATSDFTDRTIKLWTLDGKLLKTFKKHQDLVFDLAFSPDGRMLASASFDHTVMLWDVESERLLKTLRGHHDAVIAVRFSPDGHTLASSSSDRTIKLWTVDGTLLKTLSGHKGEVNGISFSPDGKTIASASADQTVKLWQLDGALLRTFKGHTEPVSDVRFSPDGKTLATASVDKTIKLWKPDGTLLTTLKGHSDWITSIRFSPDGQTLASGSGDGTVKLWQLKNDLLRVLEGNDTTVIGLGISPDEQILETGDGNTITFWRLRDGVLLKQIVPHVGGVNDVAADTNNKLFATTGGDKMIKLWNWDGTLQKTLVKADEPFKAIEFSQDGRSLAAITSETHTLTTWNLDGKELRKIKGPRDWLDYVRISPDLQTFATLNGRRWVVELWHDNQPGAILKGHTADVTSVRFSDDGQTIATTSWDRTVKLWTLDGTLLSTLKGHTGGVNRAVISHDNQLVVSTGDDKTVRLWKRDGTLLMTLQTVNAPVGVRFSPDSKTIAFGSGTTAVLWNIADIQSPQALTQRGCTLLQDYVITHPKVLLDLDVCQNATNLLPAATNLAKANNVAGAVTLFRRALQLDPTLTLNPEAEAKKLADQGNAERLVEEGQNLALDENMGAAVVQFRAALKLNPQLLLNPELEAQTLAAKGKSRRLVQEGWFLGKGGNSTAAIANYKESLKLNPSLAIDPEAEAKLSRAYGLVYQANGMVKRGEIKPAIALYNQVETLEPTLPSLHDNWNYLCGGGSIQGKAAAVMAFCKKAVAAYPDNGEFHDSRGVARAMTGDFTGAIEDFQAFVNWTEDDGRRAQRQRWIKQLQRGNNPFTPQELQKLREKELL